MSKETPEQGDLWSFQGFVVLLYKPDPDTDDLHNIILYDGDGDTFTGALQNDKLVTNLLEDGTYIGNISVLIKALEEKYNGN